MCLQETADQCLVVFGRHRSSPPCGLAFSSDGSATYHDATRGGLAHRSEPYSPECVEGEFSEVELPLYRVLRSSHDPRRLSQSVLRIALHKGPFGGSAIVPTQSHPFSPEPRKRCLPILLSFLSSREAPGEVLPAKRQ